MKSLLKNCKVLLGAGEYTVLNDAYISINDNIIDYVGKDEPKAKFDNIKDLHGNLVIPGLINAHGHGPMTLVRGVGCGQNLQDWLNKSIFPIEAKMTPEDIYAGETWAIAEMLASGITFATEMYDFPEYTAKACLDAGFRANLCRVGLDFSQNDNEYIPPNRFQECVELLEHYNNPNDLVYADLCIHSEYLTTEKFVRRIANASKEYKVPVHVHVSETLKEHEECKARWGKTPMEYLSDLGVFDVKAYAAHCVHVEDGDIDIMAEKGVSCVHNPSSNYKLASGFAPLKKMMEKGVNVAIGTDGVASNDNLNLFEEMHLAAVVNKAVHKDPTFLTAGEVLKMATVNGAKALGRTGLGEIKAGYKADLTVIDLDKPHLYPAYDIPNILIYSAQGSDVVMTMVDGKILYDHGEYTSIDYEKAKFELKKACKRLAE